MPIPDYRDITLPALKFFADGKIHRTREADKALVPAFQLTPAETEETLPNGRPRWGHRVDWACFDLYRAELLQRPKRGHYQITPLGQQILTQNPPALTREYLEANSPAFKEWINNPSNPADKSASLATTATIADKTNPQTPEERIAAAYAEHNEALTHRLLEQVRAMDPFRFEYLVIDLLVKMGYGGSHAEAARVTQRTNDEGIDGVINEDRLGLDTIYVQAKRWQTAVGRKEVQSFVGALAGKKANKGIFITSGDFVTTATDYVKNITQKVTLINGARLAELMIEHGVGVSKEEPSYILKRVDNDYFDTN